MSSRKFGFSAQKSKNLLAAYKNLCKAATKQCLKRLWQKISRRFCCGKTFFLMTDNGRNAESVPLRICFV